MLMVEVVVDDGAGLMVGDGGGGSRLSTAPSETKEEMKGDARLGFLLFSF